MVDPVVLKDGVGVGARERPRRGASVLQHCTNDVVLWEVQVRADAGLTGSASTMKNVLPETAEGESLCFVTTIKVRGLNGTWVGCRI